MTSTHVFRSTLAVLAGIAVGYILLVSMHILIVLLVAVLIASAIRPLVDDMVKLGIPKGLATILIYLGIALTIIVFTVVIFPPVIEQLADYIEHDWRLSIRLIAAKNEAEDALSSILGRDINFASAEDIRAMTAQAAENVRTTAPFYADDLGQVLSDAVLTFVMGVYWLNSRESTITFMLELVPGINREKFRKVVDEIEAAMGSYVRGIVLVSLIIGFANFLVLTILGIPNALLIGVIVGIATAIPIVGGYIGGGLATFLAMLSSPFHALIVLITVFVIQQFENYVLTPRVMSHSTGVNPLLVMLGVFVGFSLQGVIGALVAIPVLGALTILIRYFIIEPYVETLSDYTIEGGVAIFKPSTNNTPPDQPKPKPSEA